MSDLFSECKEFLAYVVDDHEQHRTHQHGNVLDNGLAEVHVLQHVARQWQCQTVGYQVAHHDVERKLHYAAPVGALIVEGEVLVQKIAEDGVSNLIREAFKSSENYWYLPLDDKYSLAETVISDIRRGASRMIS